MSLPRVQHQCGLMKRGILSATGRLPEGRLPLIPAIHHVVNRPGNTGYSVCATRRPIIDAARVVRPDEALALEKVEGLGADRDAMQGLTLGSFVAWNRLSCGRLDGKGF